jgi:hypothetical protein
MKMSGFRVGNGYRFCIGNEERPSFVDSTLSSSPRPPASHARGFHIEVLYS